MVPYGPAGRGSSFSLKASSSLGAQLSAMTWGSSARQAARDELVKASPEEVQAEIAQLWRSVRSAQLLLAGDVSFGA